MSSEYVEASDISDVFHEVDQDVTELHAYWNTFRQMFKEQASVDAFNFMCPFAGEVIQASMIEIIILRITRLCDPAETGGGKHRNKNLTLERVIDELPSAAEQELIDDLRKKLVAINNGLGPALEHRHKRIAHMDLKHATDKNANLPTLTMSALAMTLGQICEFMNTINTTLRNGPSSYDEIMVTGDGDDLVYALKMARKLDKLSSKIMRGATKEEIYAVVRAGGTDVPDDPAD